MDDIRFYDFEFNLLHIEHDIISSEFCDKYNDIGTWEGHFPLKEDILSVVMENKYLVVVQSSKQSIITGRIIGNDLTLAGRSPNWILKKRVVLPFKTSNNYSEIPTVAESIGDAFDKCYGVESYEPVSNFVLDVYENSILPEHLERTSAQTLFEIVRDICGSVSFGHKVIFDIAKKQWSLTVYSGVEKEYLLDVDNLNCFDLEYNEDMQEELSAVQYNQKDTETYSRITDGSLRKGIYCFEGVISAEDNSTALSELSKKKVKSSINTAIKGLEYEFDYSLGDIFTVMIRCGSWDKSKRIRVVGINRWTKHNDTGDEPVFEEVI